jgi:hypothetical protein
MVAQFVAALERPVSRVRLGNYRAGGGDHDMVVNYFYNLELSEALYPSLQAFEIAFRNSIYLTLSKHFQNPYWFDLPNFFPPPKPPAKEPWQVRAIREARKNLSEEGKTHDPNRIMAELHFGFWHSLINRPFEKKIWSLHSWQVLREAFPDAPRRSFDRQIAWDHVDRIRILRNRVMHYEPIWYRARLTDDHSAILEALRWISPEMHDTIAMCDRFLAVHNVGRADMEKRIQAEIEKRYPGK